MKYIFPLVLVILISCSPKLSPDTGWARQRWVVVEMKGVPVQQSGGRRDAYINFETNEKRFTGNGGCNQINGTYTVNKSSIDFGEVMSTKMSCEDIEFENTFISILGIVDHFEAIGGDLLLKKKKETLLVLRSK